MAKLKDVARKTRLGQRVKSYGNKRGVKFSSTRLSGTLPVLYTGGYDPFTQLRRPAGSVAGGVPNLAQNLPPGTILPSGVINTQPSVTPNAPAGNGGGTGNPVVNPQTPDPLDVFSLGLRRPPAPPGFQTSQQIGDAAIAQHYAGQGTVSGLQTANRGYDTNTGPGSASPAYQAPQAPLAGVPLQERMDHLAGRKISASMDPETYGRYTPGKKHQQPGGSIPFEGTGGNVGLRGPSVDYYENGFPIPGSYGSKGPLADQYAAQVERSNKRRTLRDSAFTSPQARSLIGKINAFERSGKKGLAGMARGELRKLLKGDGNGSGVDKKGLGIGDKLNKAAKAYEQNPFISGLGVSPEMGPGEALDTITSKVDGGQLSESEINSLQSYLIGISVGKDIPELVRAFLNAKTMEEKRSAFNNYRSRNDPPAQGIWPGTGSTGDHDSFPGMN